MASSFALTVGQLYGILFPVPATIVLDRIGIYVSLAGTAGSKFRMGIYDSVSSTDVYPHLLKVDGGEEDGTVTTAHKSTISTTLTPGTYWLTILAGTAGPTVDSSGPSGAWLGYDNTLHAAAQSYLKVAQAYGALPATCPSSGTLFTGILPNIMVRASS